MRKKKMSPALQVIIHADRMQKKGKNPSLPYKDTKNPKKALALAKLDYELEPKIPFISDKLLFERMNQIKYVKPAMQGLLGKAYFTQEQDEKYFDLFYVETSCNLRNEAFNFDDTRKITKKATGLQELLIRDIFVKIGGYYGFCKITFAEVMAQIPNEIASDVVAFALDPKKDVQIINEDYQSASIIFYGKNKEESIKDISLPSVEGLIKPLDIEKAIKLKDKVKPIIKWDKEGYTFIEPGEINNAFMDVGIWMRINGSNIHRTNPETPVSSEVKLGEKITTYQSFNDSADNFEPTYAYVISQIPDELINENTIGFIYKFIDYFRTKEGVIHKTECTLVEKVSQN
ncbi:MAG: hypothetical protein WAV23_02510 [Minisyncoccia bacterium]